MQISNHHCRCAASYLTDGVVVRQSLHILCSLEACLGGFPFQFVDLPFQPAHFLPGPFGICPQLLLFTLTLLLLAFPFILQSRQVTCGETSANSGRAVDLQGPLAASIVEPLAPLPPPPCSSVLFHKRITCTKLKAICNIELNHDNTIRP